ncbi:MAG: hypothetical protein AAGD01_16095 [Acidobacteriota bacterium]
MISLVSPGLEESFVLKSVVVREVWGRSEGLEMYPGALSAPLLVPRLPGTPMPGLGSPVPRPACLGLYPRGQGLQGRRVHRRFPALPEWRTAAYPPRGGVSMTRLEAPHPQLVRGGQGLALGGSVAL